MKGNTHLMGGAAAGILSTQLLLTANTPEAPVAAAILIGSSLVGSLFPDIDHPGSKIGKKVKILSGTFSMIFGHRKFCHSIWFLALLEGLLFAVGAPVMAMWGFGIGYLSHIALDMLTVSGVQFLSPVSDKNFRVLTLRTSSWHEILVNGVLFAVIVAFILMNGDIIVPGEQLTKLAGLIKL